MSRGTPHSNRWTELARGESGSASLEFVTAGLILLVPLVYLVVALAQIQSGALAVEGAARQAARAYVLSDSAEHGRAAVERALHVGLVDYGVDPGTADAAIECSPSPTQCLEPRSTVAVVVRASVTLPFVPPVLGLETIASVPLEAKATQTVSVFGGANR